MEYIFIYKSFAGIPIQFSFLTLFFVFQKNDKELTN